MILIYTSFGCSSTAKAKFFFDTNQLSYYEKNIQTHVLNKRELQYLIQRCPNGFDDVISKRGKIYKKNHQSIQNMTTSQLIQFIQRNPTLLKRPILISETALVIGFDGDEITTFLPSDKRNTYPLQSKDQNEAYTKKNSSNCC